MKITSLHFKNLNSLKGEFKIDFRNPELANAGLFAITGPTGAGKSTILDAITLALYSYTPRIGSINKNTIADKGVVVTKHTRDAFAHIIFEVNNELYKAEWAIAINNRGNWGDVSHKLSKEENDEFVSLTVSKSETYNRINTIIGLDENQFTKAIVLSQGKFDEFLKAKKDDRYALLEIITGTQIYRELGKKVYQALGAVNAEMESLENRMGGIALLSEDEIKTREERNQSIDSQVNAFKKEISDWETIKANKESIIKLNEKLSKIDQDLIDLQQKSIAFEPEISKMGMHEKAMPLQVLYNNWNNAKIEIANIQTQIAEKTTSLKDLIEKNKELVHKLSTDTQVDVTTDNFLEMLADFSEKISVLDAEITSFSTRLDQQGKNLQLFFNQIPSTVTQEIYAFRFSTEKLNSFYAEKEKNIVKITLPADFNGTEHDGYISRLNNKAQQITQFSFIKSELEKKQEKIEKWDRENIQTQNTIAELKDKLELLNTSHTSKTQDLEKLEAAAEAIKAIKGLEGYRNSLEDGKPCPCCGSEVHPYAVHKPTVDNTINQSIATLKKELKDLEKSIRELEVEIINLTATQKNYKDNRAGLVEEIKAQKISHDNLGAALNIPLNSSFKELEALSSELAITEKHLKIHKEWTEACQPLRTYIDAFKEYEVEKETLAKQKNKRSSLFGNNNIVRYQQDMNLLWNTTKQDISNTENIISVAEQQLEVKKNYYQNQDTALTEKLGDAGFDTLAQFQSALLTDAEYNRIKSEQEALKNKKIALHTTKENAIIQLDEAIKADTSTVPLDELASMISERETLRDQLLIEQGQLNNQLEVNQQNIQKVAGIAAELEKVRKKHHYHSILAQLIGDNTGNKFNNIIQRITLRYLFDMTNQRLKGLMERYQVDLGGEGMEDEIWVIDTYMGDEKRTINSVSGGERFVISLAMALSLSDLASNNVRIDSLFIDEGFGSLSPDDLDNAMNMLERMQVENEKTIGLISHVESLKERIVTQIQVAKLQNGESTLYLSSNGAITSLMA